MNIEAIFHKQYSEYAYPSDENTFVVRLRTKRDDIRVCILIYHEKYDTSIKGTRLMKKVASDRLYDYYETSLSVGIKRFKYMFYLEDDYNVRWYNQDGFSSYKPDWGYFSYSFVVKSDIFMETEWFKNKIVYQVFPDRFYKMPYEPLGKYDFFGGSMRGIIDKVDYFVLSGVDCIYLNPVFSSPSYHRYDTENYYEIDPRLGSKEDLLQLVKVCHEKGIKIILDAVLNHCSDRFFAFCDVVTNGEKSIFKDWFYIDSFPIFHSPKPNYECFSFFGGMPKFNTSNKEVEKYLIDVLLYWTKEFDIDGWRFDVADELDRGFIRKVRHSLKTEKKDIILIGEVFDEASSWLLGDQFDSVINYPLKALLNDLVAYRSINSITFKRKLDEYLMKFKKNTWNTMVNIIGSHDTPRFLTSCGECIKRFQIGVALQFTLPGVPLVYYGDEKGMTGGGDPHCRKPMIWDRRKWNGDIANFYNFIIELRRKYISLQYGDYRGIELPCEEVFCFVREYKVERLLIVVNTSDESSTIKLDLGSERIYDRLVCLKDCMVVKADINNVVLTLKPLEWKIYRII